MAIILLCFKCSNITFKHYFYTAIKLNKINKTINVTTRGRLQLAAVRSLTDVYDCQNVSKIFTVTVVRDLDTMKFLSSHYAHQLVNLSFMKLQNTF